MSINLYKILGVRRNARPESIRRAYREKVMACHPDRGGDPELFKQVQLAGEVLQDPERRARYDASGETDAPIPEQHREAIGLLTRLLTEVLQSIIGSESDPCMFDLVSLVREKLATRQLGLRMQLQQAEKTWDTYKSIAERFTVDEGENYLRMVAEAHAAAASQAITQTVEQMRLHDEIVQILKRFRFQRKAAAGFMNRTVASATNWPWTDANGATSR